MLLTLLIVASAATASSVEISSGECESMIIHCFCEFEDLHSIFPVNFSRTALGFDENGLVKCSEIPDPNEVCAKRSCVLMPQELFPNVDGEKADERNHTKREIFFENIIERNRFENVYLNININEKKDGDHQKKDEKENDKNQQNEVVMNINEEQSHIFDDMEANTKGKDFINMNTTEKKKNENHFEVPANHSNTSENAVCNPPMMNNAEVSCRKEQSRIVCYAQCLYGLTYQEGIAKKFSCLYTEDKWTPSLAECEPFVDCQLQLKSRGFLNCSVPHRTHPTFCTVSCEDTEASEEKNNMTIWCDVNKQWVPSLPSCAEPKGIKLVPAPLKKVHNWPLPPRSYYKQLKKIE